MNVRQRMHTHTHTPRHQNKPRRKNKTKSRCLSFGARPLPSRTPDVSCLIAAAPVYRATKNAPGCPEAPVSQSAARTGDKSNGPRSEAGPVPRRRLRFSSISLFLTRATQWRRPVNDSYGVCHRKPRGQPHFLCSPERESQLPFGFSGSNTEEMISLRARLIGILLREGPAAIRSRAICFFLAFVASVACLPGLLFLVRPGQNGR